MLTLVKHHDRIIEPTEKSVKRAVRRLGSEELFEQLLKVKKCDVQAQAQEFIQPRLQNLKRIEEIYSADKKNNGLIFSVKNLAINGNDIIAMGVKQGKTVGNILNSLLESVLNGEIENRHDILIKKVSEIISH